MDTNNNINRVPSEKVLSGKLERTTHLDGFSSLDSLLHDLFAQLLQILTQSLVRGHGLGQLACLLHNDVQGFGEVLLDLLGLGFDVGGLQLLAEGLHGLLQLVLDGLDGFGHFAGLGGVDLRRSGRYKDENRASNKYKYCSALCRLVDFWRNIRRMNITPPFRSNLPQNFD